MTMKRDKKELDVDFIGGLAPLTKEEAQAISNYLKTKKSRKSIKNSKRKTPIRQ